uniref:Calpain catalytic domain-containing protein n=1 Tax=Syphacia muris TaxID=451379 RepID=A0A0N5AK69_9BILA
MPIKLECKKISLEKQQSYRFKRVEVPVDKASYNYIDRESGRILNAVRSNDMYKVGGGDNILTSTGKLILDNKLSKTFVEKTIQLHETSLYTKTTTPIDFEKERQRCLEQQVLFEDPYFPADDSSLFSNPKQTYARRTEFHRNYEYLRWLRPNEIVENPRFFVAGQSRFDVIQGSIGDCYLIASVATLAMHPALFYRVVPMDQSFTENYAGIFHFQFWYFGKWTDVVIDDRLPTRNGKLVFVRSEESDEFWSALLEKAYAKLVSITA